MKLNKYSFGHGDRFGLQGKAQLAAVIKAKKHGIDITPIWNKSHREHSIIGTGSGDVRTEADTAVKELAFDGQYLVDADHINLSNVDLYIDSSDFFTLDVADYIGQPATKEDVDEFVKKYEKYVGSLEIPGIDNEIEISKSDIERIADKVLLAVKEAGNIYHHIEQVKGKENFITEVSMDETDLPQSPIEMFFILAAIADQDIHAQTIAPKFTGRFNKGVDYVGDIVQFEKEFNGDLAVIAFAVKEFGLSDNLKLSVHSGSDKFSIYAPIKKALEKFDAGLHLKTAGTTWLEEIIGLAASGGDGLELAKKIYEQALQKMEVLCEPYKTVIDIDRAQLPSVETVKSWSSDDYVKALKHDQSCDEYNLHLRQLLHVGYKIAANMGETYLNTLKTNEDIIAQHVTENIYDRHIKPLFI